MSYLIYLTIWLYRYFNNGFDTVSHEGQWTILAHLGCPRKFLTILRLLH